MFRAPGRSERLALRLFAAGSGIVALVTAAVALALRWGGHDPAAIEAGSHAYAVSLVTLALFGCCAALLPPQVFRPLAALGAATYLVGVALTTIAALSPSSAPTAQAPWLMSASAAAVIAGLVVAGLSGAWSVLLIGTIATQLVRALTGGFSLTTVVNDGAALLTGVIIGFVGALVLQLTRHLDEHAQRVLRVTRQAAAERGRLAARRSTEALMHDEVLATLAIAATDLPVPSERIREQSVAALALLEQHRTGALSAEVGAASATRILVDDASRIDPAARLDAPDSSGHGATLPAEAFEAIRASMRQAIENSLTHAPRGQRVVRIATAGDRLTVEISDTGPGFDPARVPEARLGLRTSIVQRMRAVGGAAEVRSSPGAGTRVQLSWGEGEDRGIPDAPTPPTPEGASWLLHLGTIAIALVFVLTQVLAAGWAAAIAVHWWAPLTVLALFFLAGETLRLSPSERPGLRRTALAIGITLAAVVLGSCAAPFTFGEQWFVTGAAFLLATLAFRSRVREAVWAGLALVAIAVLSGVWQEAEAALIVMVVGRPVIVLTLTVVLAWAVELLQRRIAAVQAHAVGEQARASLAAAKLDELGRRGNEMRALVAPTLERLASEEPIGGPTKRDALALEGTLRDMIRAGRLAESPLSEAVHAARSRGVDVVMLDDRAEPLPDGHDWPATLERLALAATESRERIVVRLLPAGREALVACTVDGRVVETA